MDRDAARQHAWDQLRDIAYPDSRYHLDFAEFIPGYPGCEEAPGALSGLRLWPGGGPVFVTPDGSTEPLRAFLLRQGRPLLTATHGGRRGFRYFPAGSVPIHDTAFAATLDGAERFGRQITAPAALRDLGPFDFLVTGASAVSVSGIRFGKGHGYFDLEWAVMRDLGLVGEDTPVVCCVHDVQVADGDLDAEPNDTAVDWIITPTRTIKVSREHLKPGGVDWSRLSPGVVEGNPVLRELAALRI
jgi:5-formyltetrahydrofolate cyclo-ligase